MEMSLVAEWEGRKEAVRIDPRPHYKLRIALTYTQTWNYIPQPREKREKRERERRERKKKDDGRGKIPSLNDDELRE